MPKETGEKLIVQNKKARHDYAIEDKYEAGLALTGTEVKSLREGRASLSEAFISIDRRGEMWLEGANIPEYLNGTWNNHAPKRKRKLLLHRLQITKLARGIEAKGYTRTSVKPYAPCATPTCATSPAPWLPSGGEPRVGCPRCGPFRPRLTLP